MGKPIPLRRSDYVSQTNSNSRASGVSFDRHEHVGPLCVALLIAGRVPVAYGYTGDATKAITGMATHSSFHYELVRARGAGEDQ